MAKAKKTRNKKYNPKKLLVRPGATPINDILVSNVRDFFPADQAIQITDNMSEIIDRLMDNTMSMNDFYILFRRTILIQFLAVRLVNDVEIRAPETIISDITRLEFIAARDTIKEKCLPALVNILKYYMQHKRWRADLMEMKLLRDVVKTAVTLFPFCTIGIVTRASLDTERYFDKFVHEMAKDLRREFYRSEQFRDIAGHLYPQDIPEEVTA